MAIPNSNITENYAAFQILRQSQLNTAMDYIDTQFNTYTKLNFIQIGLDVFGNTYDYNNDGIATFATPLIDLVGKLADNETVTGDWTFEGAISFEDVVTSNSTFTSSGQMRCKAYLDTAAQSISNNTNTGINFNNEVYDVGSMHDNAVNNNRITIPANGAGLYSFSAQVTFEASLTGRREVSIYKNGAVLATSRLINNAGGFQAVLNVAVQDQSSANDYYEVIVFQDTGGALNVIQGSAVTFFNCMKVW